MPYSAGGMPSDFKLLPAVGSGVYEIRIYALGEWRVVYVAKFHDAVYVLHAFHKKTQKRDMKILSWPRVVINNWGNTDG